MHRSGGWVDTYLCLLGKAHKGLHAERLRHEALERDEDGGWQTEISQCRSRLEMIEQDLANAAQDNAAIAHSLRVWERIDQGVGVEALAKAPHDAHVKATANIKRLQGEKLRNDLVIRGLQVWFQCPIMQIDS